MRGNDLDVAQVSASVEHGRDVRVTEHVRVCPGDLEADGFGEVPQAAGGGVPDRSHIGLGPAVDLVVCKRWRSICVLDRDSVLPGALGGAGPNGVPD